MGLATGVGEPGTLPTQGRTHFFLSARKQPGVERCPLSHETACDALDITLSSLTIKRKNPLPGLAKFAWVLANFRIFGGFIQVFFILMDRD